MSLAFSHPPVAITPEWEAFFVAILLDHGTRPAPELYGFDRHNLEAEIARIIDKHPAAPPVMSRLQRCAIELTNMRVKAQYTKHQSDAQVYFSLKMAAAYLDWLYAAGRLREQQVG